MEFEIRAARTEDSAGICRLNRIAMGYDFPLESTSEQLRKLLHDKQHKIFVAVSAENVLGYLHACNYDLLYAPHMKNIMGFAVLPEYRRQGIGKALVDAACEWAKSESACGIRLVSGASRKDAHAFYRAYGFVDGKEQLNFKLLFGSK